MIWFKNYGLFMFVYSNHIFVLSAFVTVTSTNVTHLLDLRSCLMCKAGSGKKSKTFDDSSKISRLPVLLSKVNRMDADYEIGQSLIIELDNECFVGELKLINKDRTRIELSNVFDFNTGEQIVGNQIFYKSDIKSIKLIKNDIVDNNQHQHKEIENDHKVPTICEQNKSTALLTACELQEIESLCRNAQTISKTDLYYHDAIKTMRRQNEIVLCLEGCQAGRNTRTSILTLATRQNVYIFDIISLGQVFPELKEVLEANRPKKIIHDSRKIVDNLKHRQNIEMQGIFDTYAAHIGVGGDKSIWNLETCAKKYLNLPDLNFISEKSINWHSRPIDSNMKTITAKKALFTYKLYDRILHDYILNKFYKTCEMFATVYSNNKDSMEAALDMASNKNSSANEIEDIDLDLPVEMDT